MNVTKITYEQYVSIIECGGKAFAFFGAQGGHGDIEHAHRWLVEEGVSDERPDPRSHHQNRQVCYTLTE